MTSSYTRTVSTPGCGPLFSDPPGGGAVIGCRLAVHDNESWGGLLELVDRTCGNVPSDSGRWGAGVRLCLTHERQVGEHRPAVVGGGFADYPQLVNSVVSSVLAEPSSLYHSLIEEVRLDSWHRGRVAHRGCGTCHRSGLGSIGCAGSRGCIGCSLNYLRRARTGRRSAVRSTGGDGQWSSRCRR
jgi:hypothetical protein